MLDYGPVGLPLGKARRYELGTCDAEAPVSFGIQVRPGVDDPASVAQVAEHAGFAYVAVRDRSAPLVPTGPGRDTVSYDAVTTLSYVAAATRRIRLLGLGDVLPCCDPGMIARRWATLDALSGGRAILGVGGAMDLLVGAKSVIVATTHLTKKGEPKIVEECSFPLTGARPADLPSFGARREALRARYLRLLLALAGLHERAGRPDDALAALARLVAEEPTHESAHAGLMRLYASVGNRAAALRQFRTLRKVLAEELGVTPSAEANALHEEIARGPAVHAPLAASGLFIGREGELERGEALLGAMDDVYGARVGRLAGGPWGSTPEARSLPARPGRPAAAPRPVRSGCPGRNRSSRPPAARNPCATDRECR